MAAEAGADAPGGDTGRAAGARGGARRKRAVAVRGASVLGLGIGAGRNVARGAGNSPTFCDALVPGPCNASGESSPLDAAPCNGVAIDSGEAGWSSKGGARCFTSATRRASMRLPVNAADPADTGSPGATVERG